MAHPALSAARRRLRLRVPPVDQSQGPRRAERPASRGVALQRRHLRHGPVLRVAVAAHARPSASRSAPLRADDARGAAQGHPLVPPARRHPRARRRVVPVPGRRPRPGPRRWSARCGPTPRRRNRAWPGRAAGGLRPPRRGQSPRGDVLCLAPRWPTRRSCAGCGPLGRRGPGDRSWRPYVGERANRRHRPGRALERTEYRFDVVSDYGAFRDLQRHRMLTIEWQDLGPGLGYEMPRSVVEAGIADRYREVDGTIGRPLRSDGAYVPRAGVLCGGAGLPCSLLRCR